MKKVQYKKATLKRMGKLSSLTMSMGGSNGNDSNNRKPGMGN